MPYTTLITTDVLASHLNDPDWIVVDCRFALSDAELGRTNYLAGHIPGAEYAHLDEDLSGPIQIGVTGRHPLPKAQDAAAFFGRLGIAHEPIREMQVVAYDDAGGALAAARLWWMLRWLGHRSAAILDGGWQAWQKAGLPGREGVEVRPAQVFLAQERPELVVNAEQVESMRQDPDFKLLDARSAERFRGENETLHPVAGHIPGARSAQYADNLTADGRFRSPDELRARFRALLEHTPIERVVVSCGSGVTAAHNLLALEIAGLGEARLYPGSWSEWITDPRRPVAKE